MISYAQKCNEYIFHIIVESNTFFFFNDAEPHRGKAFWTHPWGVNHGYTTPPARIADSITWKH